MTMTSLIQELRREVRRKAKHGGLSQEKRQPWKASGISRSTWFRRRKAKQYRAVMRQATAAIWRIAEQEAQREENAR